MCTNCYLHTKSKHTGVEIHIPWCLVPDSRHVAKNGQLSCRQKEERADVTSLSHIGIFVRGVLGSFNVLLVDQHLDALLDDRDGGGEPRLVKTRLHNYTNWPSTTSNAHLGSHSREQVPKNTTKYSFKWCLKTTYMLPNSADF